MIAAFVAASAVFVILLQIEKKTLEDYEKAVVYVATEQIPRGEWITEENKDTYLERMEIDRKIVPEQAITETGALQEQIAVYTIAPGTVITAGMFETAAAITAEMERPVIAGFRAEDLYQVVGGVLRAGDRINLYCIEKEAESQETVSRESWKNVFVQQVFDQSGSSIASGDDKTPAQRVNIYLEEAAVPEFYGALAKGTLRAVRLCDGAEDRGEKK